MSKKQTTEYEQWLEIAAQVNAVQAEMRELLNQLNTDGDVPKTVYGPQNRRANDALSQLKSDLENRMFEEHPEKASTDDFYGRDSE